jgi:signal transduction histidine kinase
MKTEFAPAERLSEEEILRQYEKLAALPFVKDFLDSIPNMTVVLNEQRQIVFANRAFAEFLGLDAADEVIGKTHCKALGCIYSEYLGMRPGEAAGCIRAELTEGGCGTTHFCRTCGAVLAILNSQNLRTLDIQECRMLCGDEGESGHTALDLRVWSRPIEVEGETFTVFSVVDISDEKRRQALERIFFHDVLNTAGGVKGLAGMLMDAGLSDMEVRELSGLIAEASEQLIDEINAQRTLSAAERGDLQAEPEPVNAVELVRRVIRQFHSYDIAENRTLQLDAAAEGFEFDCDPVLLRRVLVNLVKNALEAVPQGEAVTLHTFREDAEAVFTVHDAVVMPADVQANLFTRSFSTKGRGRGLGTYSIRLITEKYLNGRVSFVSDASHGTVFTIRLPA